MSSNNEKSTNFEKVAALVDAVTLLASGAGGVAPTSPDMQTQKPNYSIVEQQESEAQKRYEALPKIAKTPEFEEQLDKIAEKRESEQREEKEKDLETSLNAESLAKFSGPPDPESEEGEYVSEYMKDIESRLESGTLTLKSPEEQSENELSESESESSESETESESESHSEMKWG